MKTLFFNILLIFLIASCSTKKEFDLSDIKYDQWIDTCDKMYRSSYSKVKQNEQLMLEFAHKQIKADSLMFSLVLKSVGKCFSDNRVDTLFIKSLYFQGEIGFSILSMIARRDSKCFMSSISGYSNVIEKECDEIDCNFWRKSYGDKIAWYENFGSLTVVTRDTMYSKLLIY